MNNQSTGDPYQIDSTVAFQLGLQILSKWKCSTMQKARILDVSVKLIESGETVVSLSDEQLIRISYLANIHASLRTIFNCEENVYGFMKLGNLNPLFEGRTPLSFIETGDLTKLKLLCDHMSQIGC